MTWSSPEVPAFAPFAHADGLVVTAGIAALDPASMRPVVDDFEGQAKWTLQRLDRVLADAGAKVVLRVECFLADREWYDLWNACYLAHFADPRPPRTTLVCGLPVEGLLVEVQALASCSERVAGLAGGFGVGVGCGDRGSW